MVTCGCFSSGEQANKRPKSGYVHQSSFPQPPTTFQQDDTNDIFAKISEIQPPVEAERYTATVNRRSTKSTDFSEEAGLNGSRHALLAQPSGGFIRTSSLGAIGNSSTLRKSISERGGSIQNGNVWTESRKELELAIHAEKAKDHADWNPDLQTEEQRLRKRLTKLTLEMKVMIGDGNCQFRAVSHGLYGSQDYHQSVRQKAVEYMRLHKEDYAAFLGQNIDEYLDSMEHSGTWGDELTLRAISDYWGIVINVVTSDQHNWFMRYKPPKIRILLEIFLTYIAPVHYNAIRRQTVAGALRSTLSRQTSSSIDLAMKRAYSAERALATTKLAPDIREAIRCGHRMDGLHAGGPANPAAHPSPLEDPNHRRKFSDKTPSGSGQYMDPVEEVWDEGRISVNSSTPPTSPANRLLGIEDLPQPSRGNQGEELFANPLMEVATPRQPPVSAFAAQAGPSPTFQQMPLNGGKADTALGAAFAPEQAYQTVLS